jgi:uncharacterized protein (TIGR03790 family)
MACLAVFSLAWMPGSALALEAADLVVVFNRHVPESQAVAAYYAARRQVPPANVVGVEVSTTEDMSRQEFDQKLAPPVRERAAILQAQGRTPAVLLVYGIPLRVPGPPATRADQELKELAAVKVAEYQKLVLQSVRNLDRLTGAAPPAGAPPDKLTYPTRELLTLALKSCARGADFLNQEPAAPEKQAARQEVTNLMIKLGGTSPEGRALLARTAQGPGRPRQGLLGGDASMQADFQEARFRGILPQTARDTAAAIGSANGLIGELKFWDEARRLYDKPQRLAAVDSELTLIMAGPCQSSGWLPNPFNLAYEPLSAIRRVRARTLMVGRLDGPTPAIARRLVDDALEVEKTGLTGVLYIDGRGLASKGEPGSYAWFDQHLVHLADLVKKYGEMQVVLDHKAPVFSPGSCPQAALYCGWYSVRKYVPAFQWQKGAVGYHVASYEARTLKQPASQVWCKRMLEEGVAATLGPVTEPFLHSFPLPDQFFPILMSGKLTLLEVYFATVPQVSWMQILIGDPLYRPFKNRPAIRPPSPQEAGTPKTP